MALGAILATGWAVPAHASTIDFSGFYSAQFISSNNLGFTGGENLNETWFNSRLRLDVNFQATDEVSVHWRFQAPGGHRWGTDDSSLESVYYYGQAVQDWGTVRVGRIDGGVDEFGLSSLGWAPNLDPEFTYIAPFEGASELDGIQYSHTWDNGFALKASYAKIASNWDGGSPVEHRSKDHDYDRFQIEGAYSWDGGGAALNVMYDRDATGDGTTWNEDGEEEALAVGNDDKTSIWYLNPALMHSWGAFSFHAEAKFGFGETRYYNGNLNEGDDGYVKDVDAEGQGMYLDFDYNYGPGRVNLAGWWVSGNDLGDTDNKAAVDIVDGNFYPLVVAYGYLGYQADPSTDARVGEEFGAVAVANNGAWFTQRTGLLSVGGTGLTLGDDVVEDVLGDPNTSGSLAANLQTYSGHAFLDRSRSNGSANHWALMLSGQHSFTDEITLSYAAAYLALTNPNYRMLEQLTYNGTSVRGVDYHTQDKDLGWELDLGLSVQLLDNLAFTSTFGYMFTGDAYRSLKGYNASVGDNGDTVLNAEWEDADDSYSWVNSLVFSF